MLPVVVTFMMSHWAIKFMRDMTKKRMAELQTLSGQTVGILSGIEEIKSYQVQDWAAAEFDVHNEAILHRSMKITKIRTLVLPIIGYTDRIMKVLILAVGGSYLINADITIGELTALLSYATLLAMPFISLGMLFSSYQTCIVSLESMRSILDEEVPEQEFDNLEATEREALFKEGISAKNLSFTYTGDDKPTLNDINFTIRPPERRSVY